MQSNTSGSSRAGGVGTTLSLTLLALLLIAVATVFCYKSLQPKIEADLSARVATALQATPAANNFTIQGQHVVLAGATVSANASQRIEEAALSVYGVSGVVNNLKLDGSQTEVQDSLTTAAASNQNSTENSTESDSLGTSNPLVEASNEPTPATLTIAAVNNKVRTQGIVPDAETIDRISSALSGKFGGANIDNELSSFDGSAAPAWLDGMLSMIDQLDGITNPVVKVTGKDVVLGGSVNTEAIRRVKIATAERLLGSDLKVIDNLSVKPADEDDTVSDQVEQVTLNTAPADSASVKPVESKKRPASIEIRSSNNQISLTGFVANAADADTIRGGLNNLFGANGFDDELTVSNAIEPAAWLDDALSVASEIRNVPDFAINIRAGQMSLSGSVEDRETARDLAIAATEIAGSRLGVLNNFSVNNITVTDSNEDLLAQSLMQELDALPTRNIVFNKNSTTLTDSAKEVLDDVAAAILGYSDLVVEIAGHTDSTGDAVRNLRLSQQRAVAVRDYLVEQSVPTGRLSPIGYGETAPVRDNETDAGRAANRRIEFNL